MNAAHSDRPPWGLCPSRSPESATRCDLRDDPALHAAGHEAYRGHGEWLSWSTTADDKERWANVER